ncbi:MAG TPA: aldo/keto reductase, partial [Woeseiaceae bacterium]
EAALEAGVTFFDTADKYGDGKSEELLGQALEGRRDDVVIATKIGWQDFDADAKRSRYDTVDKVRADVEGSLRRLRTDVIDLYYLHRWDRNVPIEDSVGAMARMVGAGKVGAIGLSEVSAATLRRAHAVHPIAAVQTELSLWTRNAEIAVVDACRDIGAAFVAFSPLARGFLANPELDPGSFPDGDIRRGMPRFQPPNFAKNQRLSADFAELAKSAGCSPAQLALAWVLGRRDHAHLLCGTTSVDHLEENVRTLSVQIGDSVLQRAGALINEDTVSGPRYPEATQREIDTEQFSDLPQRREAGA